MPTELEKKIQERLEELPEDVQKAVKSTELGQKIQALAKKYALHIDQAEALDIETRLVMLGFTDPEEFSTELKNNVRVSENQADVIAQDVSAQIFLPIRESMRQYMEEKVLQAQLKDTPQETDGLPSTNTKPSVIMPSAANTVSVPAAPKAPSTPAPSAAPKPVPPSPAQTPAVKPVDMHAADLMLSQPTVSVPPKITPPSPAVPTPAPAVKAEPPKPAAPYKADPYREPPE